eukprot:TRINITY_DN1037_c0_g1_i2.p2 TRINITY_DN1037_c0_g1~~TRINITY_DN1037_c0_g1_i2.p2  ORF type:complete len:308 (+),score=92.48 TRINITY_DN1037_c0_g1_i2:66-926(+)
MKRKELEIALEQVDVFQDPKIHREQYPTGGTLASHMLFDICETYDDIDDKFVLDLGCGCGVLAIGASIMGAGRVIAADIDSEALDIAAQNLVDYELDTDIDLVQFDVVQFLHGKTMEEMLSEMEGSFTSSSSNSRRRDNRGKQGRKSNKGKGNRKGSKSSTSDGIDFNSLILDEEQFKEYAGKSIRNGMRRKTFDTVIMNPPFGTRNKGIDMLFLQAAFELSKGTVYSLHKSSTREFIRKRATEWGANCDVMAQMNYSLPKSYSFHKEKVKVIEVDLWRFDVSEIE